MVGYCWLKPSGNSFTTYRSGSIIATKRMKIGKVRLTIIYMVMKAINKLYRIAEKCEILCLCVILLITATNVRNQISNIALYISLLILLVNLSNCTTKKINNVLCIDIFLKQINMNIDINVNKLKNTKNKISQLNYLVDEFISGISKAAEDTKRYGIKSGKPYYLRTHGAVYVLFEKKLKHLQNSNISYDVDAANNIMKNTKDKKLSLPKLTMKDKMIFVIERILLQKSLKDCLNNISEFNSIENSQICELEVIFDSNKKTAYIKKRDKLK